MIISHETDRTLQGFKLVIISTHKPLATSHFLAALMDKKMYAKLTQTPIKSLIWFIPFVLNKVPEQMLMHTNIRLIYGDAC